MSNTLMQVKNKRPVAVIGAGTLGRRIALMMSTQNGDVLIFDRNNETAKAGLDYILANQEAVIAKIPNGSAGKVTISSSIEDAVKDAWIVFEALPEIAEIKIDIMGELDDKSPDDAILATNSSSYPSSEIIGKVKKRNRVMNTHFMMPPECVAVEIMSCGETTPELIENLAEVLKLQGLSPYIVRKESMGFIQNRIWAAIKREVLTILSEGIADPVTIDNIFMETLGTKQAPCRLMDSVGLDVVADIESNYQSRYTYLPSKPLIFVKELVKEGKLGRKSGSGLYDDYHSV